MAKKLTHQDFITRSNIVHNNKYDYSLVEYVNNITNVKIICPEHGTFWQTPNNHLRGSGCKPCGILIISSKKKLSANYFINRSNIIHNNKYDYSLVEYVNSKTKVKIICPEHGTFEQSPSSHLGGYGCRLCRSSIYEFIKNSNIVHNNKYDYSLVEYINSYTKVKIICPLHGVFEQRPSSHICGSGCKPCGILIISSKTKLSANDFINRSNIIHNNKYDYSLVEYVNNRTTVKIICKEHGTFEQTPKSHLNGHGCRLCNIDNNSSSIYEFIKNSNIVHNNKYDYSLVEYINSRTKVKIICPEHGIFVQIPSSHISGNGCSICAGNIKPSTDQFISKANILHNNKYDYSLVEYVNNKTKVKIICPVHGIFEQTPSNHLIGQGCQNCTRSVSVQELEICSFLDNNNIQYIQSERSILGGKELDIYIPSHNIAIEFDGIYWHSEGMGKSRNYHLNKTKECADKNIQLLHIFENEWLDPMKQSIWKSIINNKLGICSRKIFARKCQINEVDNKTVKQFLLNNHLQGHTPSSINIGLYYENELVSLMTFGKSRYNKNYQYELIRFCNKINTLVIGSDSKIFKYFNKTHNPESIISYTDMRYSNGALYETLGFNRLKNSTPNYFYFHKSDILNLKNRVQFQKHKLKDKIDIYNSELTEYQNMLNNGYDRIWDCGNCTFDANYNILGKVA